MTASNRVKKIKKILKDNYTDTDMEANAVDLLADLMHYCEKHVKTDFNSIIAISNTHYEAERQK